MLQYARKLIQSNFRGKSNTFFKTKNCIETFRSASKYIELFKSEQRTPKKKIGFDCETSELDHTENKKPTLRNELLTQFLTGLWGHLSSISVRPPIRPGYIDKYRSI